MADRYRVRFLQGYDPDWSDLEQWNTPENYQGNEYYTDHVWEGEPGKSKHLSSRMVPFEEYIQYLGNPDRKIMLICIVEKLCPCCDHWHKVDSMDGIDCMDDDPYDTGIFYPEKFDKLNEWQRSVAREMISDNEAGYPINPPTRRKETA